jgi:hypothetical protein
VSFAGRLVGGLHCEPRSSSGNAASLTVDTTQRFRIYCLVDGMFE